MTLPKKERHMDDELDELDRAAEVALVACDTHWRTCARCSRSLECGDDRVLRERYVAAERDLMDARTRVPRLVVLR